MSLIRQCIVLNPNAGSADDLQAFDSLLARVPGTIVRRSRAPGDATRLALEAVGEGFDRVVAAGGDGTLNEVLNGVAEFLDRIELGLLPVGTANDFARSVGIPADLESAVEILERGRVVPLDGVRLEGDGTRYFLNASAGGFSAVVSDRLEDEAKSAWGPLAYSWTALKSLPDLKEYRIRLRVDDGEEEALGAYNVVIANAGRIAGGIPVAPWAVLDDGLLDVLVIPSLPLARFTLVASQILLGSHRDHPDLVIRRGSKVSIESDPDVLLNTDGEVSAHSPATFTVLPRRVRFVVGDFPH